MPFNVKAGGVWKTPTGISVKAGGVWKGAQKVWVKAGGVWKEAWSAMIGIKKANLYGVNSSITKATGNGPIVLYSDNIGSGGGGETSVVTTAPMDLTSVTRINIEYKLEGSASIQSDVQLIVSTSQMGGAGVYTLRATKGTNVEYAFLDIDTSGLSGPYYIRVHCTVNGGVNYWKRLTLHSISYNKGANTPGELLWYSANPLEN